MYDYSETTTASGRKRSMDVYLRCKDTAASLTTGEVVEVDKLYMIVYSIIHTCMKCIMQLVVSSIRKAKMRFVFSPAPAPKRQQLS